MSPPPPVVTAVNAASSSSWRARLLARWRIVPGLLILCACFLAGRALQTALGLIIPGHILGVFLLLTLLAVGVVRLRWIEEAATLLLWLLPLLFMPPFVVAAQDRSFWTGTRGIGFAIAVAVGLLLLWVLIGLGAQWLLGRFPGSAQEPGPLTDAEMRESTAAILQDDDEATAADVVETAGRRG